MIKVLYTPRFLRLYYKLPSVLREEAKEKIQVFKNDPATPALRVHPLKGVMKGYWSFRVNYKYRIVFEYDAKDTVALLAVGDHSVYD